LVIDHHPIHDVAIASDYIYAFAPGILFVLSFADGELQLHGSVVSPGQVNSSVGRMRLFVGGDRAYITHRRGYNTIDVSNPDQPELLTSLNTAQFGWKHIVANGSGIGIAAVSPNASFGGPNHVSRYNIVTGEFETEFPTSGVARAVSIYNGLAYIADHNAGLQVINYLAFDSGNSPPDYRLDCEFLS